MARHGLSRCAAFDRATRKLVGDFVAGRLSPPVLSPCTPLACVPLGPKRGAKGDMVNALACSLEFEAAGVEDGFGVARGLFTALDDQITSRLECD